MCSMWTIREAPASSCFGLACQLDLEGIVAKRANSPYEDNTRSPYWIKIKIRPKATEGEARRLNTAG